jgi:hypothetical protein
MATSAFSSNVFPIRGPLLAGGIISVLPICLGINGIFRPQSARAILGLPEPAPADRKLVHGLVRLYGVRNLSMGMASAIMTYFGHTKALAWYMLGSSVVAFVDGFVAKEVTGTGEWPHWVFVVASVGLSRWLLASSASQ